MNLNLISALVLSVLLSPLGFAAAGALDPFDPKKIPPNLQGADILNYHHTRTTGMWVNAADYYSHRGTVDQLNKFLEIAAGLQKELKINVILIRGRSKAPEDWQTLGMPAAWAERVPNDQVSDKRYRFTITIWQDGELDPTKIIVPKGIPVQKKAD